MSGGSMDYLYLRVKEVAEHLSAAHDTKIGAFGRHLSLVAKALHDVEWWMSGDTSREDCEASLDAVVSQAAVLEEATRRAVEAREKLDEAIRASARGEE